MSEEKKEFVFDKLLLGGPGTDLSKAFPLHEIILKKEIEEKIKKIMNKDVLL